MYPHRELFEQVRNRTLEMEMKKQKIINFVMLMKRLGT